MFDKINAVDLMIDLMKHFANNVDNLSIEQKRLAIRTFVKKIIRDGECAHIVLVGSEYNESLSNIVKTAESINKTGFFYDNISIREVQKTA